MTRRYYSNVAAPCYLTAPLDTVSTTFQTANTPGGGAAAPTGYPSSYPFGIVMSAGTAAEEVMYVTNISGSTWTVTRGAGIGYGTATASHSSGDTIDHYFTAVDADEASAHAVAATGAHGLAGSVVGTTDVQTLTNKTITGATLDATSTHGGVSGTSLAADRTAWTTYTPTFTNITGAVGQFAYKLIGKTLVIRGTFTGGTATATGAVGASVPSSTAAGSANSQYLHGWNHVDYNGWAINAGSSTIVSVTSLTLGTSLAGAGFTGVIELV